MNCWWRHSSGNSSTILSCSKATAHVRICWSVFEKWGTRCSSVAEDSLCGHQPYWSREGEQRHDGAVEPVDREGEGDAGYADYIKNVDTIVMGRRTYEWVMEQESGNFPYTDQECFVFTSARTGSDNFVTRLAATGMLPTSGFRRPAVYRVRRGTTAVLTRRPSELPVWDECLRPLTRHPVECARAER